MSLRRPLFLLACVVVVSVSEPACIQVPDIEPARAQVRIVEPADTAYTNGVLEVRLEVTGHPADRVELLLDGEVLTELAPPYTYLWETSGTREGTYRLEARAVLGVEAFWSEERGVVVDRTPPRVVSRTPEPGAEDVWVRSPIRAVFSEAVKEDTVTGASVRLTVGTVEVARTVSLSGEGRTLTVEPVTVITAPNVASLVLTQGLKDLAGNPLGSGAEPWDWAMPYWVPWGSANDALFTDEMERYVFDPLGAPVAIWRTHEGSREKIYVKRWDAGEWKSIGNAPVAEAGSGSIQSAKLELDPLGNPIIAWSHNINPTTAHIQIAQWTGTNWDQLEPQINTDTTFPHKTNPTLQWSPSNQLTIAWSEYKDSLARICVKQKAGRDWYALGSCTDAYPSAYVESVTQLISHFASSGNPILTWVVAHEYAYRTYVSQLSGNTWHTVEGAEFTGTQGAYVSMQSNQSGQPIIAWSHYDGTAHSLSVEQWNGEEWERLGNAQSAFPGNTHIGRHSLQMDSSGVLFSAWDEQFQLHVRRWNGDTWQPVEEPSLSEQPIGISSASLQRTRSGEFVLTWFRHVGSNNFRLRVRRLNQ